MATSITTEASPVTETPAPGKKRLLVLIAIVVILLGAGVAAWLIMKPAAHEDKPVAPVIVPPVFMELEPFTVNLDAEHILQATLSLQLHADEDAEQLKRYLPQVRSRLLLLMSSRSAETLKTPEGKEALSRDIADRLKQPYAQGLKPPVVQGVYLTAFVIQ